MNLYSIVLIYNGVQETEVFLGFPIAVVRTVVGFNSAYFLCYSDLEKFGRCFVLLCDECGVLNGFQNGIYESGQMRHRVHGICPGLLCNVGKAFPCVRFALGNALTQPRSAGGCRFSFRRACGGSCCRTV